ncbi:nitroreductase family protein [Rummeliibacillus sp. JY-2-4R]
MATTTNHLFTIMQERKSVRKYDPSAKISKEELADILTEATTAPSSSNLQPWRFLVIQDENVKKELRPIANNQEQVETASALIAVLGDTKMYENTKEIYNQNVSEGHMDQERAELLINNTIKFYSSLPKESLYSIATFDAGLISMQIMLLAKEHGYDTVPMGGFDRAKFAEYFKLEDHIVPILLISIGKAAAKAYGSSRLGLDKIAKFI